MELVAAQRKYDTMVELKNSKINTHRDDIARLHKEKRESKQLLKQAGELLTEYQKRKPQPILYEDLYEGGIC